ncbi:MAG: MerR family transcriptional regulator [Cellulomonadaceae bacterium]
MTPSTQSPAATLSISEAARRTGLSVHTLRYYERDGLLLGTIARSSSGHRRFAEADIDWIVLVARLRATGMSISEVRAYAALVRRGEGTEAERLELLRAHRRRVLDRLTEVRGHLAAIDHKISVYAGRLSQPA